MLVVGAVSGEAEDWKKTLCSWEANISELGEHRVGLGRHLARRLSSEKFWPAMEARSQNGLSQIKQTQLLVYSSPGE